jgi:hypothetical protein
MHLKKIKNIIKETLQNLKEQTFEDNMLDTIYVCGCRDGSTCSDMVGCSCCGGGGDGWETPVENSEGLNIIKWTEKPQRAVGFKRKNR